MQTHRAPTVAIKTLGCKLNQFESQQIREQLRLFGSNFVPFESFADIYVINSCTVTSRTDRDCRRLIRHARKLNPHALVVVTGCYAEVNPQALAAIPEADIVVGNRNKTALAGLIRERLAPAFAWRAQQSLDALAPYAGSLQVEGFSDHTRAFVKIQEGCDAHCTYCIVPRARGRSRSVPTQEVREQVKRLIAAGHPEIVLIGIHLGKYGEDLPDSPDLAGLLEELSQLPGLGRLRLSSIEPMEIGPRLIELVTQHPRVCRHLHIPLQSGCDSVLRRMGRPYAAAQYADLVGRIYAAEPRTCLGADVMVGFPGETDEEFDLTRAFAQQMPLSYLHVFTFSPREGTPAADMPEQVPHEVKIARNHELRALSEAKRSDFASQQVGQTVGCVLERVVPGASGLLDGLTDNYLRVHVAAASDLMGTLQTVTITRAAGERLMGSLSTAD